MSSCLYTRLLCIVPHISSGCSPYALQRYPFIRYCQHVRAVSRSSSSLTRDLKSLSTCHNQTTHKWNRNVSNVETVDEFSRPDPAPSPDVALPPDVAPHPDSAPRKNKKINRTHLDDQVVRSFVSTLADEDRFGLLGRDFIKSCDTDFPRSSTVRAEYRSKSNTGEITTVNTPRLLTERVDRTQRYNAMKHRKKEHLTFNRPPSVSRRTDDVWATTFGTLSEEGDEEENVIKSTDNER